MPKQRPAIALTPNTISITTPVLEAGTGADYDVLEARPLSHPERLPYALADGITLGGRRVPRRQ